MCAGFSFSGCSYLHDKTKRTDDPPAMKMGETACLQNIKSVFVDYSKGNRPIEEVDQLFDCMIGAINKFTDRVEGSASKDGYTLAELEKFMLDYFQGADDLTVKLMTIGFEIKSISIGGKQNNITRKEIDRVKHVIETFKTALRGVDPYKDILLVEVDPNVKVDSARLEKAVAALNQFATTMSAELGSADGSAIAFARLFEIYKLFSKPELLKNPSLFSLQNRSDSDKIDGYQTLASNLKAILISGKAEEIRCEEWPSLIKSSARLFGIYLRYQYGLKDRTLGEGDTVNVLANASNDFMSLLQDAVSRADRGIISSDKISELIKNYSDIYGTLPGGIRLSSLSPMFPKIFTNVLRPSRIHLFDPSIASQEQTRELGIGNLELRALSYYVHNYIYGLGVAHDLMKDRQTITRSQLINTINTFIATLSKQAPKPNTQEQIDWGTRFVVLKEYLNVFDPNLRPLQHLKLATPRTEADIRAPIVGSQDADPDFNSYDVFKLNQTRTTVELVLRSFSNDLNKARKLVGLDTDEAESLYRGMREIGFDMGVADPRSQNAGHRTFMEANLFMSNSNGDDYIGFREAIEWFDFAMSSGDHAVELFNGAYEDVLQAYANQNQQIPQSVLNDEDVFGRVKVDIRFFRKHFRDNFGRYFANLPGFVKYIEQLKREGKYQDFEVAIEDAARYVGHTDDKVDSSAVRTLIPILYYIESIYLRFDKNHSGILENDEAWEIFPLMKNTIKVVSNGAADTEWKQKMVFARLLMSGEPPPDDWTKYFVTTKDWLKEKWYKPSVDRLGIVHLIGAITTTTRKNAVKAIVKIYDDKKETIQSEMQNGYVILDQLHEISRCSPGSLQRFRQVMQANVSYILAPRNDNQKYDGQTFVFRLQTLIRKDKVGKNEGLSEQCQPLLAL